MSSSYNKEVKANLELDKAWERYLANSDDLSKIIELLAKIAKTTVDGVYEIKYNGSAKELAQQYMKAKANGAVSNVDEFCDAKNNTKLLDYKVTAVSGGVNFLSE